MKQRYGKKGNDLGEQPVNKRRPHFFGKEESSIAKTEIEYTCTRDGADQKKYHSQARVALKDESCNTAT